MPEHIGYRIDEQPCIPVRTLDGRHTALGLRRLLSEAHLIHDLALPIPPASSALLRIATAITARLTGLDDSEATADEWSHRRRQLLEHPKGFDPDAVNDYFDRHIWDLLHPTRPFLQDPLLAQQCTERAGVNALVYGRPAGNNFAWFSPHTDTAPTPLPCDQALWHLLIHHSYGPAGRCSTRTLPGRKGTADLTAAPLRSTVSYHPRGNDLYTTLLLHVPKPIGPNPVPDSCPWEESTPPDPARPPPPITSPGRLLTARSRHALLLIAAPDHRHIVDAYLTWATTHPRQEAIDPYLSIRTEVKKPAERRLIARRADATRATWRDLDGLLLARDETPNWQRPRIFDTLNDLPADIRATVTVRVHGFDQEAKTVNHLWYTALTPPILAWAQEHDPQRAARIADCCRTAEQVAADLARQTQTAWKATTGQRISRQRPCTWHAQALAQYWPRAETTFWRLLDTPDLPPYQAFAQDAVHALRSATRPALLQHRNAAKAVAAATTALRTGRRSTAPPKEQT